MRAIVVAITGPSGAGKTTLVAQLARRFGWVPVDEAFYRVRPRPSLSFATPAELRRLELRLLVEESRRFLEAIAVASEGRTVVTDTNFLDPVGYTAGLVRLGLAPPSTLASVIRSARRLAAERRLGVADLLVRLEVPAATRRARVESDPAGHPRTYRSRHEAVGRAERRWAVPALARAFPGRVRRVAARGPVRAIAERVGRYAGRLAPLRDPFAAAGRALDALEKTAGPRPARRRYRKVKNRTLSPGPPDEAAGAPGAEPPQTGPGRHARRPLVPGCAGRL